MLEKILMEVCQIMISTRRRCFLTLTCINIIQLIPDTAASFPDPAPAAPTPSHPAILAQIGLSTETLPAPEPRYYLSHTVHILTDARRVVQNNTTCHRSAANQSLHSHPG